MDNALKLLVITEQKLALSDDKRLKELEYSMGLYVDAEGVYRLKGRLENSILNWDKISYISGLQKSFNWTDNMELSWKGRA